MRSEHKRQGKGQDRVYFAGYLSSWGTCNFIVGYLYKYCIRALGGNHRRLKGEREIQQCGAGTRGG